MPVWKDKDKHKARDHWRLIGSMPCAALHCRTTPRGASPGRTSPRLTLPHLTSLRLTLFRPIRSCPGMQSATHTYIYLSSFSQIPNTRIRGPCWGRPNEAPGPEALTDSELLQYIMTPGTGNKPVALHERRKVETILRVGAGSWRSTSRSVNTIRNPWEIMHPISNRYPVNTQVCSRKSVRPRFAS